MQGCPAPVFATGKTLKDTEADDTENRARWLVCIERYAQLRACVHEIRAIDGAKDHGDLF